MNIHSQNRYLFKCIVIAITTLIVIIVIIIVIIHRRSRDIQESAGAWSRCRLRSLHHRKESRLVARLIHI